MTFQVKIRGFRIELGEIENSLSSYADIKQVAVLAKERTIESGDNKYLVAYYVSDESLSDDLLIHHLNQSLPDYMIPSAFVQMEAFPLTLNGKLDRKALPDPEFTSTDRYVAPRNELEAEICNLWQSLLGLDQVGVSDDFFRVGGDSILAIQVAHRMSAIVDSQISVADIFKYKTIQQLERIISSGSQVIIPVTSETQISLSFAQERLWFIEQYEQGTNAYHIPMVLELSDIVDHSLLKEALSHLVNRHEVLRTVFKLNEEGIDYQAVLTFPLMINQTKGKTLKLFSFKQALDKDINQIFNLKEDYPIRVVFYEVENNEDKNNKETKHYLLINIHHIAFDGWSTDILLTELNRSYESLLESKTINLPALSIQYKDFTIWQKDYLQGEVLDKQIDYWKGKLQGIEPLSFPTDHRRPAQIDYSGKNVSFSLDKALSKQLKDLSKEKGCTLYSTLLTGFYILLHKYTGQEDIVIGTPIANRHFSQLENLIGFFVNSLPLPQTIKGLDNAGDLITQVHQGLVEAQSHQDIPFEKIVEELKVEQDPSRHPIFQIMFGLQNFGESKSDYFKHANIESNYNIAKHDLSLFLSEQEEHIIGSFNYATALFDQDTIERINTHYQEILKQLAGSQSKTVQTYQVLTAQEYNQIVYEWNDTDKDYPEDKTIYQLFQEQVEKTPHNIAIVFEDNELTYQALNEQSNQLARYIRKQYQLTHEHNEALKPDTLIALCLDRSIEMIVAILGTLKAGAAYVPIDPSYPEDRIHYILEDTQAPILLTQTHLIDSLNNEIANHIGVTTITLDEYIVGP